jgi:signal transduction histidine kinase
MWDDRGLVFGSNLSAEEERALDKLIDLRATGQEVLAAADERVNREVSLGGESFLLVATSVPETISSATYLPGEHWFLATLAPVTSAFAELRQFQARILIFLLLGFLAVGAFLLWISRRVSGPLVRMTGFAEEVARGRRDLRLDQPGRDEIGRLGRSLDALTASLQTYERELVGKEALATLGRTSAMVAHEIRNPLNGIRGSVQYLQLKFPDDPVIDEYARLMLDRVDWLAHFVDSLLRFARLPAPRWERVEAAGLFTRTIDQFSERAKRANVEIRMAVSGDGRVECDPDQIVELLQNLVHNALDAAGRDGEVVLSSRGSEGCVELCVRDSGPGIDPAMRARLFVPFHTSKSDGTGLGLVICRMIAANHGGSLELDESGPGGAFVVRLPRRELA